MSDLSMKEMLEAGIHFGHQTRYWNPKMADYLFGHRNKIHIINLEKTLPLFQEALNFVGKLAAKRGTVLFVGTKQAAQQIIKEEAQRCEMPYVNLRWLGGLLTNYQTVKQSIKRLQELEERKAEGGMEKMSKKETLHLERELEKLERNLSGIKDMNGWPDALFVLDVGYEDIAVSEARKLKIPIVGVVDSNNDPDGIDYVIPGNDDAIRSIRFYARGIADAIIAGRVSVAHLGEGRDKEEFVELDANDAPVAVKKEGAAGKRTTKKKKKKVVAADPKTKEDAQADEKTADKPAAPKAKAKVDAKAAGKPSGPKADAKADENAADKPAAPKADAQADKKTTGKLSGPKADAKADENAADKPAAPKAEAKADEKTADKPAAPKVDAKADAKTADKPAAPKAKAKVDAKTAGKPSGPKADAKADEKAAGKPAAPKAKAKADEKAADRPSAPKAEAKADAKEDEKSADKPAAPKTKAKTDENAADKPAAPKAEAKTDAPVAAPETAAAGAGEAAPEAQTAVAEDGG